MVSLLDSITSIMVSPLFAMASQGSGQQSKGGILGMLFPLVIIFGIFYFLMIRPQQKQQKKHKTMLNEIKKGDEIITRGGIHGTVHGIADNILTLEIAENVKIKVNKEAIAGAISNKNEK